MNGKGGARRSSSVTLPVRARLGDPAFHLPAQIRGVAWDRERGLVLLVSESYYVLSYTRRAKDAFIAGTSSPPFIAMALCEGERILIDRDSIGRFHTDREDDGYEAIIGDPVAAALTPDASRIAVLMGDGTLELRNGADAEVLASTAIGERAGRTSVELSLDGERIAVLDAATLRVVDLERGVIFTHTLGPHETARAVYARDGVIALATGHAEGGGRAAHVAIALLDAETGHVIARYDDVAQGALASLARLDDDRLAFGLRREDARDAGRALVFDVAGGRVCFERSIAGDAHVATHTGRTLLVAGARCVSAWDTDTGEELTPEALGRVPARIETTPNGVLLASYRHAALWNEGRPLRRLALEGESFGSVSADGASLVARRGYGTLWLLALEGGEPIRQLGDLDNVVGHTRAGDLVAMNDLRGNLAVVDVRDGTTVLKVPAPTACNSHLTLTPGGTTLAAGVYGELPQLWDVRSGKRLRPLRWSSEAHGKVRAYAMTRAGAEVVIATNAGALHRFHVATGREIARVKTKSGSVNSFAVSADGALAAMSAMSDPVVHVVSIADGRELGRYELRGGGAQALTFAADDALIVAAPDATVVVLDLAGVERVIPRDDVYAGTPEPDPTRIDLSALARIAPWDVLPAPYGPPREIAPYGRAKIVSVEHVGYLSVPTGELVAGDLWSIDEARALPERVAPGQYPVFAVVFDSEPVGLCVQLAEAPVERWTRASVTAGTDSASIVVADKLIAVRARALNDAGEELIGADVLRNAIPSPGVALFGDDARGYVAALQTGMDGGFPVLLGLTADGAIAALRIDCGFDWDAL